MRIYTELYIGIILTKDEYIHLFTKEINKRILKVLNKKELNWIKNMKVRKKCLKQLDKFKLKMIKDPLHNLKLYLNMDKIMSSENSNFIHEIIHEQLNNPHLIDHKFPSYLTKFNKNIDEETEIKFDLHFMWYQTNDREEFYIMGYEYGATFKLTIVSELGLDISLIIKFLNEHNNSKKLKNTDIHLSTDIIGIINKYLTINISKKKVETIIHNYND